MRLTRRGWAAVALVVGAVALAWMFGERSLNAVAAPTLAALVVAGVAVWRADVPDVSVTEPRAGFPDERRTIGIRVDGSGLARVHQSLPEGLSGPAVDETGSLPLTSEREVTLETRGVYDLDPPEIRQRDPLGLFERRLDADASAQVVVYPQVYTLADPTLGGLLADPMTAERQEFDRLREYEPGDPLKNVHWTSSAKYNEYLVMEFSPTERSETLRIAAEADPGGADRMAGAVATLADAALQRGLTLQMWVPDGHLPPGAGEVHRENAMRLLAQTDHGEVDTPARSDADVVVSASPRSTTVHLAEGTRSFDTLVTGQQRRTDSAIDGMIDALGDADETPTDREVMP